MLGKRELASRLLNALSLTQTLGGLRSALVRDLRVLAYHRVLPELDEASYPFDIELVSATLEEFDWQMAYVARRFRPVSCQQVADAMHGGQPLPRRAVMVTFDDGFDDNHDVAFPVLVRHRVPGLFFLSTGYVDTAQVFWFDWLVHVLLRTTATQLQLDALQITLEPGDTLASRRAAAVKLLRLLKRAPEALRLQTLDQLERVAGVEMSESQRRFSAVMTWTQVRAMAAAGMEFGSHTVSHPTLPSIADAAVLRHELEASKAAIEREIGRPVLALAYPVGGRDAVNPQVLAATRQAGYRLAFTYQKGINRAATWEPWKLKRVPVERYTTRPMFAAALELPEFFAGS